jgi:alginate O-acetyltransferase complex protein AlgI
VYFLPQLVSVRKFSNVDVRGAVMLFLAGFIKKACIADGVAPTVDHYFAHPADFTPTSAWIGVLFYAIQIYCDFSGYTDMAIAAARLLGYQLPNNFQFPYFARNVSDFWRRWHISLSSWLRDYLYIPLGGNRGSRGFAYRNVMITMLLGGLWHGAAWTFVIWGALHGFALLIHREWIRLTDGFKWAIRAMRWLAWPITIYAVCVAWVFFRAHDLGSAGTILKQFVLFRGGGNEHFHRWLLLLVAALALIHWLNSRRWFAESWRQWPAPAFAAAYGCTFAVVLLFVPPHYTPFIYFQF